MTREGEIPFPGRTGSRGTTLLCMDLWARHCQQRCQDFLPANRAYAKLTTLWRQMSKWCIIREPPTKMSTDTPADEDERRISTTELGTDFEHRIQALYGLLGYRVRHNEHLSSRQCDLICDRHIPGGPVTTLLVECKYRESGTVPKSEVTLLVSEYETLKHPHHLSAAVIVTNAAFTAETRALYSTRTDVLLITESSLSDELINVTATLRRFADLYRTNPIFHHYIPLKDDGFRDLEAWMGQWMTSPRPLTVLLGDFGSGKTTFLHHLKFVMSEAYTRGTASMIPCYFRLRDFSRSPDLDAFVRSQLLNEFGSSDIAAFQHLLRSGRILLMLDGFDEIGKQSDERARMRFFAMLTPLFADKGKYIITCRPSYFVSAEEMSRVFGQLDAISPRSLTVLRQPVSPIAQERRRSFAAFESAAQEWTLETSQIRSLSPKDIAYKRLAPFTSEDVDRYLQLRESEISSSQYLTWEAIRDKIRRTYDLEDLSRRPILLNLIVETLPKLPDGVEPSPAVIYGHYTAAWLNHEYSKGEVRWLLKKEDKLLFTCCLAFHMYTSDLLRLHYTELPAEIGRYFRTTDLLTLSYLATDIRGSSFLRGDGSGFFEFAHRSFAEFFAAVYLRDQMKDGKFGLLEEHLLSQEVLFFLGDLVYIDPELRASVVTVFKKRKRRRANVGSANLLGILGYSRATISGISVSVQDIPQLKFVLCNIDTCDISARVPEVILDRSSLHGSALYVSDGVLVATRSQLTESSLIAKEGQPATGSSTMTDTKLRGCILAVPADSAVFERCAIRQSHFRGLSPWIVKLASDDVVVQWDRLFTFAKIRFVKTSLEGSCLENVEVAVGALESSERCEFLGVMVQDISDEQFRRLSDGNILLRSLSAIGDLEKRAATLLKRCILPRGQTTRRHESARAVVASLDTSDRLLLRWLLNSTRRHWVERRIEPVPSMEAVVSDCLANLGAPKDTGKARGKGFKMRF